MKQFGFSLNTHLQKSYLNSWYIDRAPLWNFLLLKQTCTCSVKVNMFGQGQCFYFKSNMNNDAYFIYVLILLNLCEVHTLPFIEEKKVNSECVNWWYGQLI